VLEEIQVPVALGPSIVDGMFSGNAFARKAAALLEIDPDRQNSLGLVEIDTVDEPGLGKAERGLKKVVVHGDDSCE